MLKTLRTWALLCFAAVALSAQGAINYTDRSGTVAAGGVSQTLAAANNSRTVLVITNGTAETEPLCVNVNAEASCTSPGSFQIAPGGSLTLDTPQVVTVTAATTGHKYTAKEVGQSFSLTNGGSATISGGAGDASAANQVTGNNSLASIDAKTPALVSGRQPVDGSGVTQPISAASLPLPTGAATAAKQPSLGTAGSPSTDVISVQGVASGTALPVSAASLPLPTGAATAVAQGSTTSGQVGSLTQGAVTTAAPSYTNGQTSPLSLDTSGNLRVNVVAGGAGGGNVTGGTAHDAVGTSVNPVLTGGYASAAAPSDVSADGDAVRDWNLRSGAKVVQPSYGGTLATAGAGAVTAGTVRTTQASDSPLVTATGSTSDAAATSGGTGSIHAKLREMSGALATINTSINAANTQLPSSLGPQATGSSLSVVPATSSTFAISAASLPLPSNAATGVAQGSTTSGQVGTLTQGAVTTGSPSYTTGQTSPLSLDTSGNLRVNVVAGGAGGGAVTGNTAHDAAATSVNPVLIGGYASAAAPTDVSADGDAVRDWNLRSGAKVVQPSYGGNLAAAGAGAVTSGTVRTTQASDSPLVAATGSTTDAAATSGGTGTIHAKLREMSTALATINTSVSASNTQLPTALGATTMSGSMSVTLATDDPVRASVSSSRMQVNPISGQVGVAAGSGTVGATTQRVTLATDDTLAATVSSSRVQVNPISGQAGVAAGAGAVGATTQRVTLASDDPLVAKFGTVSATAGSTSRMPVGEADGTAIAADTCSAGCGSRNYYAVDMTGYSSLRIHVSTVAGTMAFQTSEDSTNGTDGTWVSTTCISAAAGSGSAVVVSAPVAATAYICPKAMKWHRLNQVAYSSGTVTTLGGHLSKSPVTPHVTLGNSNIQVVGQTAHDSPITFAPVRTGARAVTSNVTPVATGDAVDVVATTVGVPVVRLDTIPEGEWAYAAASSGIVNTTTAVTIKAASGNAAIRSYVRGCTLAHDALGGTTELVIRDGAGGTVLWRTKLQTTAMPPEFFTIRVKSTLNTLLEVATLTAVTGGVYLNCDGYDAP